MERTEVEKFDSESSESIDWPIQTKKEEKRLGKK